MRDPTSSSSYVPRPSRTLTLTWLTQPSAGNLVKYLSSRSQFEQQSKHGPGMKFRSGDEGKGRQLLDEKREKSHMGVGPEERYSSKAAFTKRSFSD